MTTYLTRAVRDRLRAAQRDVDRHVGTGPTGRCPGCGYPQPCPVLAAAQAVFARYRQLPIRRSGSTVHAVPTGTAYEDPAQPAYDWFGRDQTRSGTDAA
jgi:hypothetical protein